MASVLFIGGLRLYTGGCEEAQITATSYRAALRELQQAFPGLTDAVLEKFSVAIDGEMITSPLLETFTDDSELVFFPRIAGG